MTEVRYQAENTNVDRELALPGIAFDTKTLRLPIRQNGKPQIETFRKQVPSTKHRGPRSRCEQTVS